MYKFVIFVCVLQQISLHPWTEGNLLQYYDSNTIDWSDQLRHSALHFQIIDRLYESYKPSFLEKFEVPKKYLAEHLNYFLHHSVALIQEIDTTIYFNLPKIVQRLTSFPADTFSNFTEICDRYGFQSELHKVVTSDGYVNTMHRVYLDKPNVVLDDKTGSKLI